MQQLTKIKIAGFKSFVDPTVLEFKSPLVGVVGPNGCGKSNIIDAVRWVMGVSSAKQLRGETMEDVIFNGSSGRKPVGQAAVELVFNNENGLIGGEYAQYNEISLRRQANRDGQSAYFINGVRCRRRDITDMFLGTGLGPKSYAIIEQGWVSKIIEAKPEVLRNFVEDPAGIAIYRQRRHETELRMRHTRENLDRLNDLRQEQEKLLDRLQRQADAQGRYQLLKESEQKLEVSLAAFRWKTLDEALQTESIKVRTRSTDMEAKLAERSNLDLEYEKERLLCVEKRDSWNVIQTEFYELGTEIARLEQTIQNIRDKEASLRSDLEQLALELEKINEQEAQDQIRLEEQLQHLEVLEPNYNQALEMKNQTAEVHQKAEEALNQWNTGFETFQQQAEEPNRRAEVEKARIVELERQTKDSEFRLKRSQEESQRIDVAKLEESVTALESVVEEAEATVQECQSQNQHLSHALSDIRTDIEEKNTTLNEIRSEVQTLKGKESSLAALQEAALGKTDTAVNDWLSKWDWNECARLGETLKIETGYEKALETVLEKALEAICLPANATWTEALAHLASGTVTLLEMNAGNINSNINSATNAINAINTVSKLGTLLSSKLQTNLSMDRFLRGIYVVSTLDEALNLKSALNEFESVVTQDGIWLGSNWVRINRGHSLHGGIIERKNALDTTREQIQTLETALEDHTAEFENLRSERARIEQQREALLEKQQDQTRFLQTKSVQLSAERVKFNNQKTRLAELQSVISEEKQKVELNIKETGLARLRLGEALERMAEFTQRRTVLQQERQQLQALNQEANLKARAARDELHVLELKREGLKTEIEALKRGIERLNAQKKGIDNRQTTLNNQFNQLQEPKAVHEKHLDGLLQKRLELDALLSTARDELNQIEQSLQAKERLRLELDRVVENLRNEVDQLRFELQSKEIHRQTQTEKLAELGVQLAEVLPTLTDDMSEDNLARELERVQDRIERLGPINLAAIPEFQAEQERKIYLDAQHKDLVEALETLDNAIRKIDKETKAKFKETFDKLNHEFQILFPKLFGGGEARLELLGDDLLEAGVSVMARPPGKRNTSIHLLSGGEKALTAVSLVFAIFRLNPAPFCLLDEVDAPLDDANVGRFCELVKEMSKTVQFIIVTHNKLAMEITNQLMGVTMKEPGVSRMVSVDIEEAQALVEV